MDLELTEEPTFVQPAEPFKKKKPLLKRALRKIHDTDFEYVCEWIDCKQTCGSMNEFNRHVNLHRVMYTQHLSKDAHDGKEEFVFYCQWKDCVAEVEGTVEAFTRHVYYHAFHQFLKFTGEHVQKTEGLIDKCLIDPSSRNLIPELPEKLVCRWDGCKMVYDNPYFFYSHVAQHSEDEGIRVEVAPNRLMYQCKWEGCSHKTKDCTKLAEHMRSHTQAKVVACPTCGSLFANNTKFIDHLRRQMSDDTRFVCSNCRAKFSSQRILRDHMRQHVNNYKCPLCDMTCPSPASVKGHVRYAHSNQREFHCPECSYRAKTANDLLKHRVQLHGIRKENKKARLTLGEKIHRLTRELPQPCSVEPVVDAPRKFKKNYYAHLLSEIKSSLNSETKSPHCTNSYNLNLSSQGEMTHTGRSHAGGADGEGVSGRHSQNDEEWLHMEDGDVENEHDSEGGKRSVTKRYQCHVCEYQASEGRNLSKHLKKKHDYKHPSGHTRFRYILHDDGLWRLQMVRYESIEVIKKVLGEPLSVSNLDSSRETNSDNEHADGLDEPAVDKEREGTEGDTGAVDKEREVKEGNNEKKQGGPILRVKRCKGLLKKLAKAKHKQGGAGTGVNTAAKPTMVDSDCYSEYEDGDWSPPKKGRKRNCSQLDEDGDESETKRKYGLRKRAKHAETTNEEEDHNAEGSVSLSGKKGRNLSKICSRKGGTNIASEDDDSGKFHSMPLIEDLVLTCTSIDENGEEEEEDVDEEDDEIEDDSQASSSQACSKVISSQPPAELNKTNRSRNKSLSKPTFMVSSKQTQRQPSSCSSVANKKKHVSVIDIVLRSKTSDLLLTGHNQSESEENITSSKCSSSQQQVSKDDDIKEKTHTITQPNFSSPPSRGETAIITRSKTRSGSPKKSVASPVEKSNTSPNKSDLSCGVSTQLARSRSPKKPSASHVAKPNLSPNKSNLRRQNSQSPKKTVASHGEKSIMSQMKSNLSRHNSCVSTLMAEDDEEDRLTASPGATPYYTTDTDLSEYTVDSPGSCCSVYAINPNYVKQMRQEQEYRRNIEQQQQNVEVCYDSSQEAISSQTSTHNDPQDKFVKPSENRWQQLLDYAQKEYQPIQHELCNRTGGRTQGNECVNEGQGRLELCNRPDGRTQGSQCVNDAQGPLEGMQTLAKSSNTSSLEYIDGNSMITSSPTEVHTNAANCGESQTRDAQTQDAEGGRHMAQTQDTEGGRHMAQTQDAEGGWHVSLKHIDDGLSTNIGSAGVGHETNTKGCQNGADESNSNNNRAGTSVGIGRATANDNFDEIHTCNDNVSKSSINGDLAVSSSSLSSGTANVQSDRVSQSISATSPSTSSLLSSGTANVQSDRVSQSISATSPSTSSLLSTLLDLSKPTTSSSSSTTHVSPSQVIQPSHAGIVAEFFLPAQFDSGVTTLDTQTQPAVIDGDVRSDYSGALHTVPHVADSATPAQHELHTVPHVADSATPAQHENVPRDKESCTVDGAESENHEIFHLVEAPNGQYQIASLTSEDYYKLINKETADSSVEDSVVMRDDHS